MTKLYYEMQNLENACRHVGVGGMHSHEYKRNSLHVAYDLIVIMMRDIVMGRSCDIMTSPVTENMEVTESCVHSIIVGRNVYGRTDMTCTDVWMGCVRTYTKS
ncbi:hypothetical protein LOAG_05081 [Loa loa]|uniref:Uncharacterized protein n=1 Tax=Loa loa TaxID=7209 RepID=A0A1S0U1J1_LOALO|nr:hypothetical protein LOAG_05081 [Loa loa]EFO23407.1 hypothetical protein LOAG_05081 [Loa loa]